LSFTANAAGAAGTLAPNNIYWSLSLEEQFYFLFPLFLLLVKNTHGRILVLFLIIAVQFPLMRSTFGNESQRYLAYFRTDFFAWGVLLAMATQSAVYRQLEPKILLRSKPAALLLTLPLVYLLIAVPAQLYSLSASMGLMAVVAASLVWLASYSKDYIVGY
jgi:peptidoglycan/LPS O-acetylase OafA/YrhL